MTNIYNVAHGVFKPQYVRNMCTAGKLRVICEILAKSLKVDFSVVPNRESFDDSAFSPGHQLPGYDVGMVFAFCDQDFVAGLDEGFAETVSKEIDRGGGAGGEDDFLP